MGCKNSLKLSVDAIVVCYVLISPWSFKSNIRNVTILKWLYDNPATLFIITSGVFQGSCHQLLNDQAASFSGFR